MNLEAPPIVRLAHDRDLGRKIIGAVGRYVAYAHNPKLTHAVIETEALAIICQHLCVVNTRHLTTKSLVPQREATAALLPFTRRIAMRAQPAGAKPTTVSVGMPEESHGAGLFIADCGRDRKVIGHLLKFAEPMSSAVITAQMAGAIVAKPNIMKDGAVTISPCDLDRSFSRAERGDGCLHGIGVSNKWFPWLCRPSRIVSFIRRCEHGGLRSASGLWRSVTPIAQAHDRRRIQKGDDQDAHGFFDDAGGVCSQQRFSSLQHNNQQAQSS